MENKNQSEYHRQWVRVSQAGGLQPFSVSLLYKWNHRKENQHLFSKVGKSLFVDVAGVNRMIDAGRLTAE